MYPSKVFNTSPLGDDLIINNKSKSKDGIYGLYKNPKERLKYICNQRFNIFNYTSLGINNFILIKTQRVYLYPLLNFLLNLELLLVFDPI